MPTSDFIATTSGTRDPYLYEQAGESSGKAYTHAAEAHLGVVGGEANLSAPYAGRLWISPSYISVRNGWALGGAQGGGASGGGTEVMHSQNGVGIATNYLAYMNNPPSSTSPGSSSGSGSMFNLGFLYENTLSNILGVEPGSVPQVTLNIFGLLADASLDLPPGSTTVTQKSIKQFKYGADVTYQALDWFALMVRGDTVNYDLDHAGYIFSSLTARLVFCSHFLSGESIYLQYSRYIYGDNMVLEGRWPWGSSGGTGTLVAGSFPIQSNEYGKKPDENVIKLQATIAF